MGSKVFRIFDHVPNVLGSHVRWREVSLRLAHAVSKVCEKQRRKC